MGARVVLVEDDASIRRFVALALEELPLTLVECASLQAGRAALAEPADLLVTDLMLPDGNGIELLAGPPPQPRSIVFSAGVNAALRERLQALGVWRILDKPVSIGALLEAVESALGAAPAPVAPAAPASGDAVQRHFGGDAALFAAFRDQAVQQFAADLAEGDRCAAAADLPALRRLAHSLKSVLLLLGDEVASEQARQLERRAADGDPASVAGWAGLRRLLADWMAR
ncbi:MAG: response regulator [Piscinibacter sp.]|uniref:response regulator n=1 Tax=Piscinibacter TaxID=1114981 RepID=UPI000FDEFF9A|nr:MULTISPECIES: response regulator [Piscinibacter]MCW5667205.1 response regulator [Piscinibacter sp.]